MPSYVFPETPAPGACESTGMRFLPALFLLLLLGSAVVAQPDPADAVKLHDKNRNGKIEWAEVQQTRTDFETRLANAKTDDAREQVELDYAALLEPMDFLLADANQDLVASVAELRAFNLLCADGKRPKPELWHHEQMTKLWVAANWDALLELMDEDNDKLISFVELALAYPADFKPEDLQRIDKNNDNKFNQAEYATFKANERLAGAFIDEIEGVVGVAGGTEAGAGAPDDAGDSDDPGLRGADDSHETTTGDEDEMKPGSSWQHREVRNGRTSWQWSRITYLDGEWVKEPRPLIKGDIKGFRFRVENRTYDEDGDENWTKSATTNHGSGCWSAGGTFRWSRDNKKLTTVSCKAGKFECFKWTVHETDGKERKVKFVRYFIELDGIPIQVKDIAPDGTVLCELTKLKR